MSNTLHPWEEFVLAYGFRASGYDLATLLRKSEDEIARVRALGCRPREKAMGFPELFSLWHGRAPGDDDWPAPRKFKTGYLWQENELALLASLVGTMPKKSLAAVLTARLIKVTNDPSAQRNENAVQVAINRIGLQMGDLLGGVSIAQAKKEFGTAPVREAIRKGELSTRRVGHRHLIPYKDWELWKSKRKPFLPPPGYVQLSSIREQLGIRSDKLSEYARQGYVPTAVRCFPFGGRKSASTQFGTWYVQQEVAERLVADRHAGKSMPWHAKPNPDNLKVTYRLWQTRRHPKECQTCAKIWGADGVPETFDAYSLQYPPLAHGEKRHLTMHWSPGLLIDEVAAHVGCEAALVALAIRNGMLIATEDGEGQLRITKTDATRWKARRLPTGDHFRSWISLPAAQEQYGLSQEQLLNLIAGGKFESKPGADSSMPAYVLREQCANFRRENGFSEEEAAQRVGVTIAQLHSLLSGLDWRKEEGIPLVTVQAAIKRKQSAQGFTIEEAAAAVGMPVRWVKDRIEDGTVRVIATSWNKERVYLTDPMMARLRVAKGVPADVVDAARIYRERAHSPNWLMLGEAADEAGVSTTTLGKWEKQHRLEGYKSPKGMLYPRDQVRVCARQYWSTQRRSRIDPPGWLANELASS